MFGALALKASGTITAASSSPKIVQTAGAFADASGEITFALAAPATAGNVLVCVIADRSSSGAVTPPSGFTAGPTSGNAGYNPRVLVYYKVAAGGEQSWSLACTASRGAAQMYEISGVGTTFASYLSNTSTGNAAAASVSIPSVSPTGAAVVLSGSSWYSSSSDQIFSAGWTSDGLYVGADGLFAGSQVISSGATITGSVSRSSGGSTTASAFVTIALF